MEILILILILAKLTIFVDRLYLLPFLEEFYFLLFTTLSQCLTDPEPTARETATTRREAQTPAAEALTTVSTICRDHVLDFILVFKFAHSFFSFPTACHPDSNGNGSYYYSNDNGSTYYNSGSGQSTYTAPSSGSSK